MNEGRAKPSALESGAARIVALGVFGLCAAILGYMHRDDIFPPEAVKGAAVNPEFIVCRDKRVATVDKMLADGVIQKQQHKQFSERAVTMCADKFPPDAAAAE